MPNLFSYGTLRQREVQLATFGRELQGRADALPGFVIEQLAISDPAVVALSGKAFHPVLRWTGVPADAVEGTVFEVTDDELLAADTYEVADYQRTQVRSRAGLDTHVYVLAADLPFSPIAE